jgi:hypothetical protein
MVKLVLRPMIGRQLDNMHEMEQYLFKDCGDIDYTIFRPSRLLDEPLRRKNFKSHRFMFKNLFKSHIFIFS